MTPTTSNETVTVKRNVFNLEKFQRESIEKEITLDAAKDFSQILEKAENDESKAVEIFNAGLRRVQIREAKQSLGGENFVSPKVVSIFVNQFRPNFPAKSDSKDDRKAQEQQIYAFIRSQDALLQAIKTMASALAAAGADEDEDEENDGQ